ncbi:Hypothetical protein FKW44_022865, partial [Caligus rogercresseyi]
TDEFIAEVKRKVNEDGKKSYAKLATEMGCSKQTIANTINKDLGYRTQLPPTSRERPRRGCWRTPLPLEPGLVAPQLP